MRYIPNLIPKRSRVLENHFKVLPYPVKKKNAVLEALGWLFGIMFLLNALVYLLHPLLSVVLAGLGILLLPPGHKWIEKKLRFRLTGKIKSLTVAALFIIAIPLTSHYNGIDRLKEEKLQLLAKKEQAKKKAQEHAEQQRKDSLEFFIVHGRTALDSQRLSQGEAAFGRAQHFVATDSERELLAKEQLTLAALRSRELINTGKYKMALAKLDTLLSKNPSNGELLYSRALCYSKTGKTADAVRDCKKAMELGNEQAGKLHEKVNPISKRVAYYITRCCDGSTSSAKGRGACSHHGGVCDWNDPVYEEYRKYE